MNYYSGYSLENDEVFFQRYIVSNEFTYSGFSFGAIKAFENALNSEKRVDLLQLFSPAFFQTQKDSFKRLQLKSYDRDRKKYIEQFIKNCFLPYEKRELSYFEGSRDDLELLLNYQWEIEKIEALLNRGCKIELYLGSEDKIVNVKSAELFFKQYAVVHTMKNANHFLLTN